MFKFNFQVNKSDETPTKTDHEKTQVTNAKLCWIKPMKNIVSTEHILKAYEHICLNVNLDHFNWGSFVLRFISTSYLEKNLEQAEANFSQSLSHNDLVPSIYEGGLKIWECMWDLLIYTNENKIDLKKKRVLELGCGAGLPGIAAAMKGASVTFQDYNSEVLNWSTIPNVLLNYDAIFHTKCPVEESDVDLTAVNSLFNFYSGDWEGLSSLMLNDGNKFDFILSSETIYNLENHSKLLDIFTRCLDVGGMVILAAKSHYFGVGGGTYDFLKLVEQQNHFKVAVTTCNTEGVKREILVLQRKL